jgi:cupin 2 domain-containing protein
VRSGNLKAGIPADLPEELVTTLVKAAGARVELIVSRGHASAPGFWYDQDENEAVFLLEGAARLEVELQGERSLQPGDWLDIQAHVRHRVVWTAPDQVTIWLAVFYRA